MFGGYLDILLDLQKSEEHRHFSKPRQEKLKKIIGALRFQKSKLHTRYQYPDLIDDTTTNHLEGINSFFKERLKLIKGFKKSDLEKILKGNQPYSWIRNLLLCT